MLVRNSGSSRHNPAGERGLGALFPLASGLHSGRVRRLLAWQIGAINGVN